MVCSLEKQNFSRWLHKSQSEWDQDAKGMNGWMDDRWTLSFGPVDVNTNESGKSLRESNKNWSERSIWMEVERSNTTLCLSWTVVLKAWHGRTVHTEAIMAVPAINLYIWLVLSVVSHTNTHTGVQTKKTWLIGTYLFGEWLLKMFAICFWFLFAKEQWHLLFHRCDDPNMKLQLYVLCYVVLCYVDWWTRKIEIHEQYNSPY